MSAPVPRTLAVGRIEGLDGWRAGLMVGGVLLHASSWLDARPLFEAVALLSHTFRMGAFFAISGFFAARALADRPAAGWLRRRLVQIGVPTLFGLGALCPLTIAIVAAIPGQSPQPGYNWFHLWFLVALLLYAPLAVLADRLDRAYGLWRPFEPRGGGASLILATALLSLLLILASSLVTGGFGPAQSMPILAGCRWILCYWPNFLLGFVVSRSLAAQQATMRAWRWPAVLLVSMALAYAIWFLWLAPRVPLALRSWGDTLLPLVGQALAPPAVFVFVLRTSVRVRRLRPVTRLVADAAFTMYLAHLPVIAALTLLTSALAVSQEVKYAGIIVATLALTLAFHHWAVRRSAWLSLIFCGQPLGEARRAAPAAAGR